MYIGIPDDERRRKALRYRFNRVWRQFRLDGPQNYKFENVRIVDFFMVEIGPFSQAGVFYHDSVTYQSGECRKYCNLGKIQQETVWPLWCYLLQFASGGATVGYLVRMELMDEFELEEDLKHTARRLMKQHLVEHFHSKTKTFTLARMASGDCLFLDSRTRRCTIYSQRPDTCRNHPQVGPRSGYCAFKQKVSV